MAAGAGTRLNPLTAKMPKPMIPIINTPIIELILKHLQKYGINDVIANTHYCSETIHKAFGGKNKLNVNFKYVYEKALSGTAGGVKACESFFEPGETFIVVSGDALTDINIKELYKKHKESDAIATMALREVPLEEVKHFGVVVTDKNSIITEFQEKPDPKDAKSTLVNTGIYIFETEIFNYIPANTFYDFAQNVFPALMAEGKKIHGCKTSDYWNDIGTINQYKLSTFEILDETVKFEMPYKKSGKGWIAETAKIGKTVSFAKNVVIGEGSVIEDNVKFEGNNVIGNNCLIKNGATLKDSILWDNVIVENTAVLDDCIIANNVVIKAGAKPEKDSVIAQDEIIAVSVEKVV